MAMKKTQEKTAYHEAGHAVAAYLLRWKHSYVSIEPGDYGSLGHILLNSFGEEFAKKLEYESIGVIKPRLERNIKITLAGHAAERLFTGYNNWVGSLNDRQQATRDAYIMYQTAEEANAYINWLLIRIRNELSYPTNWRAVQAIAQELLKKQRIGYKAARKIIKEALTITIK